MKDDFVSNIAAILFSVLLTFVIFEHVYYRSLLKAHWRCTQSRIIDKENIDQVECVLYEKKDK